MGVLEMEYLSKWLDLNQMLVKWRGRVAVSVLENLELCVGLIIYTVHSFVINNTQYLLSDRLDLACASMLMIKKVIGQLTKKFWDWMWQKYVKKSTYKVHTFWKVINIINSSKFGRGFTLELLWYSIFQISIFFFYIVHFCGSFTVMTTVLREE